MMTARLNTRTVIKKPNKGKQLQNRINIDKIAAKILKTLPKESRTSFTEIAKDCK